MHIDAFTRSERLDIALEYNIMKPKAKAGKARNIDTFTVIVSHYKHIFGT